MLRLAPSVNFGVLTPVRGSINCHGNVKWGFFLEPRVRGTFFSGSETETMPFLQFLGSTVLSHMGPVSEVYAVAGI